MADFQGLYANSEARSVSDGESDGERRLRRSRRKRGGGRYRPYSPDGSAEQDTEIKKPLKARRADRQDRYGMAPPNSTQFLLDDREARADAETEIEHQFEAAERRRVRTMSGSYDHLRPAFWCTVEPATTTTADEEDADSVTTSCSEESEADREMEREFESDYQASKRERIQSMTKSQLAAELLERDQDTQVLTRELGTKDAENQHLRKLLTAHGISPDEPVTSTTTMQHHHNVAASKSPVIAN